MIRKSTWVLLGLIALCIVTPAMALSHKYTADNEKIRVTSEWRSVDGFKPDNNNLGDSDPHIPIVTPTLTEAPTPAVTATETLAPSFLEQQKAQQKAHLKQQLEQRI
jgi:hypothetical protein